jgi:hypothetical protein
LLQLVVAALMAVAVVAVVVVDQDTRIITL